MGHRNSAHWAPFLTLETNIREKVQSLHTMSAKSLGTLPVIYVLDEQQNPLPRKTMLFEGDTNSTGGRNDVFPSS